MSYYVDSLSPLSLTSVSLSPTSNVYVKTYPGSTVVTTAPAYTINLGVTPTYKIDIDTGINDNYIVQKDITKFLMYKMLDKWLYEKYPKILKMLKIVNGTVAVVKSEQEAENNDISKDSKEIHKKKSDYIHENILTETTTRLVLMKAMAELNIKWFELPYREDLVREILSKYIKKKLRKRMAIN